MLYSADIYDAINYTMGDKKVNDIGLYCLKIPPISRHRALCWKNQIHMFLDLKFCKILVIFSF